MSGVKGQRWYHRYHQTYKSKPTRSGKVGTEHFTLYDANLEVENRAQDALKKIKKLKFKRSLNKKYQEQLNNAIDEYIDADRTKNAIDLVVWSYGWNESTKVNKKKFDKAVNEKKKELAERYYELRDNMVERNTEKKIPLKYTDKYYKYNKLRK